MFDVVRIHQRIDAIAARLRTALQGEAGAEHQERVRELKERVAGRVARLRVQRAAPEPRPLSFERSATVGLQGWRPVSES
ncbi:MAG TPA: hypothetical protein PLZ17_08970, partial [Pseudomonadota bacterium]|nr:hypothetical protein [Pseudomonadota bacterium]